eukprot:TRINITY_DN81776_c0_g1_i1.p1 TRINITY_DN81776_c0_g1~~TRINITY_DN81776_c0_g1_i1.p1  ORF type:complete len:122 (-),score=20.46 TRINITY_DN81776_c0_g1_i1:398-763(-)
MSLLSSQCFNLSHQLKIVHAQMTQFPQLQEQAFQTLLVHCLSSHCTCGAIECAHLQSFSFLPCEVLTLFSSSQAPIELLSIHLRFHFLHKCIQWRIRLPFSLPSTGFLLTEVKVTEEGTFQ